MTPTAGEVPPAYRAAQARAAAALRDLGGALVERTVDAETLEAVAAAAEKLTARAQACEIRDLPAEFRESIVTKGAGASAVFERAVGGPGNATAVPVTVRSTPEALSAEFEIHPVFAGWPGWAHGGIVAALMDDLLGQMASITEGYTATARLEIDFRRPTAVGRPLRLETRPVGRDGSRIVIQGALLDGTVELVTATGWFAVVGAGVLP